MQWLLSMLFRCSHPRTTFPQTYQQQTHVTCLDCGKEMPYSWKAMKIGAGA